MHIYEIVFNRRIKYFMRAARRLICFALIAAVLASGQAYFRSEDASRDRVVDLKDAVLLVKEFARTAENPQTFSINMGMMVSAFHVVAGLKTTIFKAKDSGTAPSTHGFDFPCLLSSHDFSFPVNGWTSIPQSLFDFHSTISSPASPPPEKSPVC